jgi:transcriptional regulator GlxA family with amidase domain
MPSGLFAFADFVQAANDRAGRRVFETSFVALEAGPVVCAHGNVVQPAAPLARQALQAVLLPPCWTGSAQELEGLATAHGPLLAALAGLGPQTQLMAYCIGVVLLAGTGRLHAQPATVSWWLAELMRKTYPKVEWHIERSVVAAPGLLTASGPRGEYLLAKMLIDRHLGPQVFEEMSKLMNLPREDRNHEVFRNMDLAQQGEPFMRQLFLEVQQRPAKEVTVGALAAALCTTERTLARKVAAATGLPAAGYLRRIKLHQVSERLVLTATPASAISDALGFSSESSMRRMFKELTGMTPAIYRATYRR